MPHVDDRDLALPSYLYDVNHSAYFELLNAHLSIAGANCHINIFHGHAISDELSECRHSLRYEIKVEIVSQP